MNLIYIIVSYIIIAMLGFYGVNRIVYLNSLVETQAQEIRSMRDERKSLITAYNEEISEISKNTKKRHIVIKEIVKNADNKNDNCLNSVIPLDIRDRVRKHVEQ